MKSAGVIRYNQYVDGIMLWDAGRQHYSELYEIFNLKHFTYPSVVSPDPKTYFPDSIFNLDPNSQNTGGPVITGNLTNTKAKMYLKTVKIVNEFVNLSTVPMVVEIRWCACKNNSQRGPISEWTYQAALENYSQPVANQNASLGVATAGYPRLDFVGQLPEMRKGFNDKWAIIKKENYVLNGGCRIKSFIKLYYNFLADKECMFSMVPTPPVSADNYLRGLTIVPLIIARSVPGLHREGEGPERMAYAPGKLGFVSNHIYTFVPDSLDQKFPYSRIYPSTYNEGFAPGDIHQINVDDSSTLMEVA